MSGSSYYMLEHHLTTRSFIYGYNFTSLDIEVFRCIIPQVCEKTASDFPHISRWSNLIRCLSQIQKSFPIVSNIYLKEISIDLTLLEYESLQWLISLTEDTKLEDKLDATLIAAGLDDDDEDLCNTSDNFSTTKICNDVIVKDENEKITFKKENETNQEYYSSASTIGNSSSDGMEFDSPLNLAIWEGDTSRVKSLLLDPNTNFPLTEPDSMNGSSAIHFAAQSGMCEIVEILVKKFNVDPNLPNADGWSPLFWATTMDVVKTLISLGANPSIIDLAGWTPIYTHAKLDRFDIVETLIYGGADVMTLYGKRSIFHILILSTYSTLRILPMIKISLNILKKREEEEGIKLRSLILNKVDKFKWSPLVYAAWKGRVEIVELFLENEADVFTCPVDIESPIYLRESIEPLLSRYAIYEFNRLIKLLCEIWNGTDINISDIVLSLCYGEGFWFIDIWSDVYRFDFLFKTNPSLCYACRPTLTP